MAERTSISDAPAAPPAPTAQPANVDIKPLPGNTGLTGGKNSLGVPQPAFRMEATPAGVPAGDPRPTWLPEKFKSPEDLAQAYGQLEQRLGQLSHMPAVAPASIAPAAAPSGAPGSNPGGAPAPTAGAQPSAFADIQARMTQEYASTGQVSPELRAEFVSKTGIPEQFVDQQLAYIKHQGSQAQALAVQRLGGEAAVKELTDWAKTRLSPDERAAFNRLVYSGDPASAQLAVDGLAAKYEAEVGRAPRIIAGRRPQDNYGGIVPFQSDHELRMAQRDPRYKEDPAYRDQVMERLNVSMKLGLIR